MNKIDRLFINYKKRWVYDHADEIELTDLRNLNIFFSNIHPSEEVARNCYYGYLHSMKEYAGIPDDTFINCVLCHGIWTGRESFVFDEVSHNSSTVLVAGKYDADHFNELEYMHAVEVGPYIAYANDYYSKERIDAIKKKNGRTLLVVPNHDLNDVNREFISRIEEVKKDFDHVIVCIFFRDIDRGVAKPYIEKGYEVVSAGYYMDYNFLRRLKTIINLSDAVITNGKTTSIVFSIYMGKPVYCWYQESYTKHGSSSIVFKYSPGDIEFGDLFYDESFSNIEEQTSWGKRYMGFDSVKSKQELKDILSQNIRKSSVYGI